MPRGWWESACARRHKPRTTGWGTRIELTVSLGCSTLLAAESAESLLRRADNALYVAKREGRNRLAMAGRVSCGEELAPSPQLPLRLAGDAHRALANGWRLVFLRIL